MNDDIHARESTGGGVLSGRHVCVVYDCLFPLTLGGAERWYRVLVERLVAEGASVTYLTRRQWSNQAPDWAGVNVVAVSGASELYDEEGTRRTGPALVFGVGTFSWMVRHRREFDAVVVCSFPFFSLLGVRGAMLGAQIPILVDYFEVWSFAYWKTYAGRITGALGVVIQRLCIHLTRVAQAFTEEGARQLRSHGFRGDVRVLAGLLTLDRAADDERVTLPEVPMVLFVGRHVKHKGVRQLPAILAAVRESLPTLTMTVVSDGPERSEVEREMHRRGLSEFVTFTGSIPEDVLLTLFRRASCTVVPSLREGYGLVVAESVRVGTPVVVANNPENLAVALVEAGVNGYVVEPSIQGMSEGIIAVVDAGISLRESTAAWNALHSPTMSMNRSAEEMVERVSTFARSSSVTRRSRPSRSLED